MRRLRVAVYHNLGSGGALRALGELTSRLHDTCDLDLFESEAGTARRQAAQMAVPFDEHWRAVFSVPLPPRRLSGTRLGYADDLGGLMQLGALDRRIAAAINRGGYDLAFVNPCGVRYTPAILRYLTLPAVYFMQEPRRATFEFNIRTRRRSSRRNGAIWRRPLDILGFEAVELAYARSDRRSARADGTYVVCNSAFSAESILSSYGIQANISYLGVDVDRFSPGRDESAAPVPYVVSVGRLARLKHHLDVVQAVALIDARARPAVHVVGDGDPSGSHARKLVEAADRLDIDLTVVAEASDEQLIAEYRSAIASVCAAELEPFGLTMLESLACGTPVVAVNQGGYREVVREGENGYLVAPDVSSLSEGISRALASPYGYTQQLLRRWVTDHLWRWEDAAARLRRHFEVAIDESPRRPDQSEGVAT